jgi:hypothetical protein
VCVALLGKYCYDMRYVGTRKLSTKNGEVPPVGPRFAVSKRIGFKRVRRPFQTSLLNPSTQLDCTYRTISNRGKEVRCSPNRGLGDCTVHLAQFCSVLFHSALLCPILFCTASL